MEKVFGPFSFVVYLQDMRHFIFIKSSTEAISVPVSTLKLITYTSATTITLSFEGTVNQDLHVILTVTSGKTANVIEAITNQAMSQRMSLLKYDAVNSKYSTSNVTGITTISI
jgi:hypothetical protein